MGCILGSGGQGNYSVDVHKLLFRCILMLFVIDSMVLADWCPNLLSVPSVMWLYALGQGSRQSLVSPRPHGCKQLAVGLLQAGVSLPR